MKRKLRIFNVEFEAMYPIGNCLVIAAKNKKQAEEIASETIIHTKEFTVEQVKLDKPKVIKYLSGDY